MEGRSIAGGHSAAGNWDGVTLAGRGGARDQLGIHEVVHILAVLAVLPREALLDGPCGREVGDTAIPGKEGVRRKREDGGREEREEWREVTGAYNRWVYPFKHQLKWKYLISTCIGRTSFYADTSSSPRRLFGCHGDFFLASSHCLPQVPPSLLPLHLRPPLCSCASPFSHHLPRHPRLPLQSFDATWASCVPTALPLDSRCGCGGGVWTASPPSPAQVSLWHPVGRARSGGGAHFYGSACFLWTPPAVREVWLDPSLRHHPRLLPRRVRGGVFVCGAHRRDGAGWSRGLNCWQWSCWCCCCGSQGGRPPRVCPGGSSCLDGRFERSSPARRARDGEAARRERLKIQKREEKFLKLRWTKVEKTIYWIDPDYWLPMANVPIINKLYVIKPR